MESGLFVKDKFDVRNLDPVIFLNPKLSSCDQHRLLELQQIANLKLDRKKNGYVFLTSSGTSGSLKLVALSKRAIQISAASVNSHLQVENKDIWINPLPIFHVGGLAIYVRGLLSNNKVYACNFSEKKWDPLEFVLETSKTKATLTALVPTQLYDLVSRQMTSPITLRAVIVGGGALSEKLYFDALALGWKILPSYGLTECSSQVATASLNSWEKGQFPPLQVLPHVEIKKNEDGFLMIKSEALFQGFIALNDDSNQLIDSKKDEWFTTEDFAEIVNDTITSISRNSDFIKIGGESVDMIRLERIFEEVKLALGVSFDCAIFSFDDERLGKVIHLAMTQFVDHEEKMLIENFKARVAPFEQIRKVHYVENIPRTSLNKILKKNLNDLLCR